VIKPANFCGCFKNLVGKGGASAPLFFAPGAIIVDRLYGKAIVMVAFRVQLASTARAY
jgi:hypothetical protein